MRTISKTALAALLLSASTAGWAAGGGDAAAGQAQAEQLCQACHMEGGVGNAELGYPMLAGQWDTYLIRALKDYRSGARNNAVMGGLAAGLSDEQIEDLAAYYSQLPAGVRTLAH